ncbi:MAG: hypothetical protein GDA55_00530 [Cellvibrionales bacterium]|nr:hypothetical protein [Cellvibrionales bacterium]
MTMQLAKKPCVCIFLLLVATLIASHDASASCNISSILNLPSMDLANYEKIQTNLLGYSAEGADVEYYYSFYILKAIKSTYYGETGKTELEYYFSSPITYALKITENHYLAPIYLESSEIISTNQVLLAVCKGELVRGIGDDMIYNYFRRLNSSLEDLLDNAPK